MQSHRLSDFGDTPRLKIVLDFLPSRSYHLQDDRKSDDHNEEKSLDGERDGEKRWTGTQGSLDTRGTFAASTARHQHTMGASTGGAKQEEQERLGQAPARAHRHEGAMQEKSKRVERPNKAGRTSTRLEYDYQFSPTRLSDVGTDHSFARYPLKTNRRDEAYAA